MNEKDIIYFIISHTIKYKNGYKKFKWPVLPDLSMGEDFIKKIKQQHKVIKQWMLRNPEKVKLAEKGYYHGY